MGLFALISCDGNVIYFYLDKK